MNIKLLALVQTEILFKRKGLVFSVSFLKNMFTCINLIENATVVLFLGNPITLLCKIVYIMLHDLADAKQYLLQKTEFQYAELAFLSPYD